ncbi:MAG TPA: N-acetylmuramoyl-L-alanine amidase-like domain-containing protein [Candidatus Binatia bacterium]|nr:N-acetylmuramoyl-L-alanine amidase-like domain-containing protein [Candidatus Binatia bacterium]
MRRPTFKAALLLCALALPLASAARPAGTVQEELTTLLAGASAESPYSEPGLRARIDTLSAALLGRRYRRDPLGEGAGATVDPDPLLSFAAFDCVTYVETVLALARARDPQQAEANLLALRYAGGVPSFDGRTHLPSVDWLPNALGKHVLAESTPRLFPELRMATLTVSLDRAAALRRLARRPPGALGAQAHAAGTLEQASLRYLTPAELLGRASARGETERRERLQRIPSGTVVLMVGRGARSLRRAGVAEAIYHFGLAIRRPDGTLVLRSATPGGHGSVRDVPFERYLERGARTRRLEGVVLLQPLPA